MSDDRRLIEDYLPIEAISAEASREKSVRKGHISTLHLWWARRPLVACRAAVYGALVPARRYAADDSADRRATKVVRSDAAAFLERLCKYPADANALEEARRHILEAHAERLTAETGRPVAAQDILDGRSARPKVLDMFAGGGAIPLEVLRLGCDAYALDLNPVAHIIELCTLVYPQKYGKPDPEAKGCAADGTWAGLAEEVRHWGRWILQKVKGEIGDLYPPIPDPALKGARPPSTAQFCKESSDSVPPGYLMPVAYLWTRTVTCKNPACKATVPLVKQTWLCKKARRYVALRIVPSKKEKQLRFEVVEAATVSALGFDPAAGSKGGNATCPFCRTVADTAYVKAEGSAGRMGRQLMAVACTRPGAKGKTYLSAQDLPEPPADDTTICQRIAELCKKAGLTIPGEPMPKQGTLGFRVQPYGFKTWGDLFTARQMLCLLSFAAGILAARATMTQMGYGADQVAAAATTLGCVLDKQADFNSSLCVLKPDGGRGIVHTFGRQALPMVWDFGEGNPFNPEIASWASSLQEVVVNLQQLPGPIYATVCRGSASALPWPDASFDAVITDPPYYDNIPYADISDFFYIWLRRTVGHLHPEHFASDRTPKKSEAVADATRHGGSREKARRAYEDIMAQSFREAHRVLKPGGEMVVVYAHKTTLGWATLVEALRAAGFTVTEAWPLDTETSGRLRAHESAALASSILLVARKRDGAESGRYEDQVRPELEAIVQERVATLWDLGISGADLVIACVGAGLRAFTRFARVEYANGEDVPATRFLAEVETAVLESILNRLSNEVGVSGGNCTLAGLDAATRFYTLWRYTYKTADLDAGEAIIFANGMNVELDGAGGLSAGARPLVQKRKSKYQLRDYTERGEDEKLGLPGENGEPVPLVDVLHRTLWLMERRPVELSRFMREAQPNREQLRLVAQALAGPALKGGELANVSPTAELSALAKLMANWRSLVEEAAMAPTERDSREKGQILLDFQKGEHA